ncbi:MAG: hypothetical protein N2167_04940 [Flavobacteriales bacterium]|nr:hypothetical protein [Flavobacteriales bacterium]
MIRKLIITSLFILLANLIILTNSCNKENPNDPNPLPEDTSVNVNLSQVPYDSLSSYRFFIGDIKNLTPNNGVIPYEPITGLFTDYASKKRFIWMPAGVKATYQGDGELLDMPVGTVLIKNFYYENFLPQSVKKILETRLMIKKPEGWIFAEYKWNDEQTEAILDTDGEYLDISFIHNSETYNTTYRLPSLTECMVCHKHYDIPIPIGIKPQHINKNYNYSDAGVKNQLQHLIDVGYLEGPLPNNINTVVDFKDDTQPIELRIRSYLDMNCAHCHAENKHCSYRPLRLAFSETTNRTNMGLCVEPQEIINPSQVYVITPGNYNKSMMYYRMNSVDESNRMPLLGRTIVHKEAVDLLKQYILTLSDCN